MEDFFYCVNKILFTFTIIISMTKTVVNLLIDFVIKFLKL